MISGRWLELETAGLLVCVCGGGGSLHLRAVMSLRDRRVDRVITESHGGPGVSQSACLCLIAFLCSWPSTARPRHYQTCFFGSEQLSTVSPGDFFRLSFPKKINKNLPDTLKGIIEGILFTVFVCGSSFSERYKVAVVFLSEELLDFSKSSPWTTCVSGRLCFRLSQSDWACVLHTQMHRQTWSWNALQLD